MEPVNSDSKGEKAVSSKKPFLRRGQGIARFGMKSTRLKFKNKALQRKAPARAGSQGGFVLRSASSPVLHSLGHDSELDEGGEVRGWGSPSGSN